MGQKSRGFQNFWWHPKNVTRFSIGALVTLIWNNESWNWAFNDCRILCAKDGHYLLWVFLHVITMWLFFDIVLWLLLIDIDCPCFWKFIQISEFLKRISISWGWPRCFDPLPYCSLDRLLFMILESWTKHISERYFLVFQRCVHHTWDDDPQWLHVCEMDWNHHSEDVQAMFFSDSQ
jgi:hypothetical protein